ncbi:MAG: ATP-dependent Clp protease ATP-binding subunit ClpC, partial [Clostridia bacterium]|nr:ATP-dependent Clp protease ATP-binding subunit ClpC [Clostridia bacterium]
IEEIAEKMLINLSSRLENLNIKVEFTSEVKSHLADKGFDPVYGARPLRREIQSSIEDALSEKILDKTVNNGDTVLCDVKDGKITFSVK